MNTLAKFEGKLTAIGNRVLVSDMYFGEQTTKAQNKAKANAKKAKEAEEADANDEWVEDADGNFVKRGD